MKNKAEDIQFDAYPVSLERVTAYTRKYSRPASVKGHYVTRIFIRLLLASAQRLSWKWAYRVGTGIGTLLYKLKIRRDVAMINLDIVYGDKKSAMEKEWIYKESMLNLGKGDHQLPAPAFHGTFFLGEQL